MPNLRLHRTTVGSHHVAGPLVGSIFDAHRGSHHVGSLVDSLVLSVRGVRG